MKIIVNESEVVLDDRATVIEVLKAVDIAPDRRGIAVAVNDNVVRRADWQACVIRAGDRIEVIQATQGG